MPVAGHRGAAEQNEATHAKCAGDFNCPLNLLLLDSHTSPLLDNPRYTRNDNEQGGNLGHLIRPDGRINLPRIRINAAGQVEDVGPPLLL